MFKKLLASDQLRLYLIAILFVLGFYFWNLRFVIEPLRLGPITSKRYLIIIAASELAAVILLGLFLTGKISWFVRSAANRTKLVVLGSALLGLVIAYVAIFFFLYEEYRPNFNYACGPFTLCVFPAMLLATYNAVWAATRKPEFYILLVSSIVSLLLAEWIATYYVNNLLDNPELRALYRPQSIDPDSLRYAPHPYLSYYPRPNWTSSGGHDRHNSLGYRGEEISRVKPEGTFRIVAVGGSTTYGTGVNDWHASYPAQLEQVLQTRYGLDYVEVINAGIGGQSSFETMINVQMRVLDLDPDLIILYQNTNDAHTRLVDPDKYMGDNIGYRKSWDSALMASQQNKILLPTLWNMAAHVFGWTKEVDVSLRALVEQPCTGYDLAWDNPACPGSTEWFKENPPIYYERNVRYMILAVREQGVDILMLTWAYNLAFENAYTSVRGYREALDEQNRIIGELAAAYDQPFYDFAADMPMDMELWTDGRHMTAEGNRIKAELIAQQIVNLGLITEPDN